ncbi:DUF1923 family maltosyltransferase [Thermotoga sp. KOL6]|uniref:DUF1923 family maltosyltransferase n=1 Tax=Thermotoga sp. KOL6 TaxID=126741 RepID=UPI000CBD7D24|nr:maltodextrin glycosyltransferase [Thermotoga sp. KOL6]
MILKEINSFCKGRVTGRRLYAVPKLWVPKFFKKFDEKSGKYFVDPYEFGAEITDWILSQSEGLDYSQPLSFLKGERAPNWVRESIVYGSLPRTTVAYNHKGSGYYEEDDALGFREAGTFFKMILLLPFIKSLGVNTIYLLPVSKMSDLFKKGSAPSPYAVRNPMELDERYHDPLLEGFGVDEEFKAFVEACHILGIRVILDFIPRTAARDSDLIKEHPDWFYWIRVEELADYAPPRAEELPFKVPDEDELEIVYGKESVKKHLRKFSLPPNLVNPEKWEKIKEAKENILEAIIREFGLITPPGFSDLINDPQPTWDDVTFLRLYLDHPKASKKFVSPNQPPYVLYDVIKASKFPGEEPNRELWEYLAGVIPHYQKRFGIDGARLDMGHALPKELLDLIIKNVKDYDPAFVMIAEELDMEKDKAAKESGYDVILGSSWYFVSRLNEMKKILEVSEKLVLPFLASVETPDTPRITTRKYGSRLKRLSPFITYFLPNSIPYVNTGQEIGEKQPMNLGLDTDPNLRKVLSPTDEFFGRLAFFDQYALHWDNPDKGVLEFIRRLIDVRNQFTDMMIEGEYQNLSDDELLMFSYQKEKRKLIVAANIGNSQKTLRISGLVWRGRMWEKKRKVTLKPLEFALIFQS